MNESCHTHTRVVSPMWISHVTHTINSSCMWCHDNKLIVYAMSRHDSHIRWVYRIYDEFICDVTTWLQFYEKFYKYHHLWMISSCLDDIIMFGWYHHVWMILAIIQHAWDWENPHHLNKLFEYHDMGWLRWVGSLKTYLSFAKEPYKRDYLLQKRPVFWRSLLTIATPNHWIVISSFSNLNRSSSSVGLFYHVSLTRSPRRLRLEIEIQ